MNFAAVFGRHSGRATPSLRATPTTAHTETNRQRSTYRSRNAVQTKPATSDLESLKAHVLAFVTAYNFAKHLKALKWRTPFQSICDAWKSNPSSFKVNPHHLIPGPHT